MKAGDLVKMKTPSSAYSWRKGASIGLGLILAVLTTGGCTVLWSEHPHPNANNEDIQNIPEAWLEVVQ